jgi:hypothetical protein
VGEDDEIKKYEELYKLSKEGLKEELERFKRVDEKASRYFSVLTGLLAVLGLAGKFTIDYFIPPSLAMDWICLSVGIILILCVLGAYAWIFSVLRTQALTKVPMSQELVDFFDTNRYIDIVYALTKGNIEATIENRSVTDRKTARLTRGYWFIVGSVVLVTVFGFSALTRLWIDHNVLNRSKGGEISMAEKPSSTPPSKKPSNSPSKPNPNIKPPKYQHVNEGYEPPKTKR